MSATLAAIDGNPRHEAYALPCGESDVADGNYMGALRPATRLI